MDKPSGKLNHKLSRHRLQKAGDPAALYLREIKAVSPLSAEEEKVLVQQIETAEKQVVQSAKDKLVKHNLRLVVNMAKKYINRGVPFLDLVQEGNIGLLKAIDKFDYRRGYRLSTYATWWIKQAITRAITEQSRVIRLPLYLVDMITCITKASRKLVQKNGSEPTPEEIAKETRLPLSQVRRTLQIISGEVPLASSSIEGENIFSNLLEDKKTSLIADTISHSTLQIQTTRALAQLEPQEAKVLRMSFGLGKETVHTLEELGRNLNLSKEKIRQIQTRALRKLKNMGDIQLKLLHE